jgi:hemerythrin-like domain-containing protein
MLRVMQLLERHHRELDTAWAQLAPPLRGIAAGTAAMLDRDAVDDFAAHYRVHITVENEVLLPRAKQLLDAAVCARLGERMAARRA